MRKADLAAQLQEAEGSLIALQLLPDPHTPDPAVRLRRIDGVICLAVPAAPTPYVNRALGFGTIVPATQPLIARLIAHYDGIERETRISIAPGHTPEVAVELLAAAGFSLDPEMPTQHIYLRAGGRVPEPVTTPGLRLIKVRTAEDADRFADTAEASFGHERGPGYRASLRQLLERARSARTMVAVLGLIDDTPVATGLLHFLGPVCGVGTGSVVPAHRGKGLQRALLAERIRIGFGRGMTRYFAFTEDPASAHNMEQLGFRRVYDQVSYVRPRHS